MLISAKLANNDIQQIIESVKISVITK